jgi:hypothetical protein
MCKFECTAVRKNGILALAIAYNKTYFIFAPRRQLNNWTEMEESDEINLSYEDEDSQARVRQVQTVSSVDSNKYLYWYK